MAKMKRLAFISLLLLLVSHLTHSRSIREDSNLAISDDGESKSSSFLEWSYLSATTETCEPTYGFLPCSSNVWGLLFLIVVYEFLLSLGGKYVATGSNLFFQIIGPGIFGASLFQFLGTIPQIVLILVSTLSGSLEAAQQRASLGMGLVAGTTVMLLTLVWGTSVVLGSYDLSAAITIDKSGSSKSDVDITDYCCSSSAGLWHCYGCGNKLYCTDNVDNVGSFSHPSAGKSFQFVVREKSDYSYCSLIVTFILLFAYIFYQIFQPWIQNRRFEYLMNKYAKDKLLRLLSTNGKPDTRKIQELFSKIDKDGSRSVSAAELRVLLLGVKMDDDDLSTDRDVENILGSFDTSGDGRISQDEFIKGMTTLISDISDQTPDRIKIAGGNNSQNNSQLQQGLLTSSTRTSTSKVQRFSNSWLNYSRALFFVTVGTVMLCALGEPLIKSVVGFSQATNLPSFCVSYLAIPFALNYGAAIQSIASSRQKTQKSISLTLSALYGGVYMNNIIGLIVFLAPVYARNLQADSFAEILVVLIICILMTLLTSFRTTFPRWLGYLVLLLYPISLALIYLVTSVLNWS
ncbi:Sodium/calcium exchanger NCL1 [Sesamum angolense]|uniref:Sodium/calcium exchanger NCL1 n=1 Tax=Sesamum angolense TaxID=2727404 RepID=A0AAE1WTF9_9LAMI|nr:Sodium/calcium exchanger NCL1 [Sesamum angolense]